GGRKRNLFSQSAPAPRLARWQRELAWTRADAAAIVRRASDGRGRLPPFSHVFSEGQRQTMRKVFYGCAALAILGVAGVYVVTDQAARHPTSLAGRCLAAAAQVGVRLDPFAVLGRSVPHVPAAPVGCERAPCPQGEVAGGLARVSKPPKLDA